MLERKKYPKGVLAVPCGYEAPYLAAGFRLCNQHAFQAALYGATVRRRKEEHMGKFIHGRKVCEMIDVTPGGVESDCGREPTHLVDGEVEVCGGHAAQMMKEGFEVKPLPYKLPPRFKWEWIKSIVPRTAKWTGLGTLASCLYRDFVLHNDPLLVWMTGLVGFGASMGAVLLAVVLVEGIAYLREKVKYAASSDA